MPPQVFNPIDFEQILANALDELGISGRVLVGVSGGADSVALLRGLVSLRDDRSLEPVAAHLNHRLRGDESSADANLVRQLCERQGVPFVEQQLDIRQIAADERIGVEEAARNVRYEFLTATAAEYGCAFVLVAHTSDDEVETVLHHILRGTGIEGLRGMLRIRPLTAEVRLARPLLDVGRACIESYLRSLPQVWREDTSNRDTSLTRNRIRHDLLPLLRDRFNPHIAAAILHLARQAAELQAVIDPLTERLLTECRLDAAPDVLRFDTSLLTDHPLHLVREVLKRAWRSQNWPLAGMGYDHWTTLADVAHGKQPAINLPGGVHAERRGMLLILTRRS